MEQVMERLLAKVRQFYKEMKANHEEMIAEIKTNMSS
jgi:hypothetical protein